MKINRFFFSILLFLLIGCSDKKQTNHLSFNPVFEKEAVSCQSKIENGNDSWHINQFQFYISDVELQDEKGVWTTWQMQVTPFQHDNVSLVGQHCSDDNSGNWQIAFSQPINIDHYTNIRFSLGVPFEKNHLNPLKQETPLNYSSMFWVWQTGHKFLRLEMSSAKSNWLFHLGSTGCSAASALRAPSEECLYPNLININLPLSQSVDMKIDLSKLFEGLILSEETMCQSEHDNEACQQLFKNLGHSKGIHQKVFEINDE
jgi:uncharacterized repeat protein (TIGR04052 family)